MPVLVPYAKDSKSHFDYPSIITATALAGVAAGAVSAYAILKAMGSRYPSRHFDGLTNIALNKVTGLHKLQAELYQTWLSNNLLDASLVWGTAAAAALGFGYLVFEAVYKPIDSDRHIRGRQLRTGAEAEVEARQAQKIAIRASGAGLRIHPSIQLSRHQECESFFFMGSQGGGKTQILWRLITALITRQDENNKGLGDKAIIFDLVKGDFTKSIPNSPNGVAPWLLSLWDKRSRVWDIGADCTNLADATSFSRGLIPMSKDPLWSTAGRAVLIAILVKLQNENGENWGWGELSKLCYAPIEELKNIAEAYYPPALAAVLDAESKTTQSIYITLHTYLEPVYRIALAWGDADPKRRVSLVNWLYDDDSRVRTLILQGNQRDLGLSGAYIRAITEMLTSRIVSLDFPESRKRRFWWILDECPKAGKLECLSILLSAARSRGFAVCVVCQDVSQIEEIYSETEYRAWMSMCGIKIYGKVRSDDSQSWVSRQIGMREVDRFTQGVTRSTSSEERSVNSNYVRDSQVQVIHPSELEDLGLRALGKGKKSKLVIDGLVTGIGKNALKMTWPIYDAPDLRPSLVSSEIIEQQNNNVDVPATKSTPAPLFTLNNISEISAETYILDSGVAQLKRETLLSELRSNSQIDTQEIITAVTEDIAKDLITEAIEDAIGISNIVINVGYELLSTENEVGLNHTETTFDQPITNPISSTQQPKKRKKAMKVYADEK